MAYNLSDTRTISFQTNSDLSESQFCFVVLDSTSRVGIATASTHALGILENAPSATAGGQYAATVSIDGVTRCAVGGAYPIGTWLVPGVSADGTGYGFSVADATSNYKYVRAVTLQTSTAAGDIVAVRLVSSNPGMDSTTA
jgi:hypothetical protein